MNIEKTEQNLKEEEKKKAILKAEKEAEKLLESRTFTPVTKESFENFFKTFYDKNFKKSKKILEQEARITGREYFMLAKNKALNNDLDIGDDIDEDNIPEEKIEEKKKNEFDFDEEAFNVDENLDDLDFDDD